MILRVVIVVILVFIMLHKVNDVYGSTYGISNENNNDGDNNDNNNNDDKKNN